MFEHFPDMEPNLDGASETTKRVRSEENLVNENETKRTKVSSLDELNPKSKGLVRDILQKLSKNPLADPFLYPVDPS